MAALMARCAIGAYKLANSVSERPLPASVANTAVGILVSLNDWLTTHDGGIDFDILGKFSWYQN